MANKFRVTATSASWSVTYFECPVTFAPILKSFFRTVVSVHWQSFLETANRRKGLRRRVVLFSGRVNAAERDAAAYATKPVPRAF